MSFVEAALFQWVNPKAWAMAVGAIVAYVPSNGVLWNVVLVALIFALVNLPSVGVWALFGTALRPLLTRPAAMRAFNVAMALLLVLSLYPILA
jgi:threonine/homoserine/homoserine lactone efflux protein